MTRLAVALALLLATPSLLGAQDAAPVPDDTLRVGVRAALPLPDLSLRPPTSLAVRRPAPGATLPAGLDVPAAPADSARLVWTHARLAERLYGQSDAEAAARDSAAAAARRGVLGVSKDILDLAIDGNLRLEIRTDRLRNERCTPLALSDPNSGCRAGFSAPRIDNQFAIRSGGVIGRRLRVAVDWDTQRDFTNSNNIQVYYEGLPDEIVRRVEFGSVNFRPPPSRYLSAGIPASNFGINALFEVGPLQLQTLAATQKGSTVGNRTYQVGTATSQPQDRQLRDLDFESNRFFWTVDPATLPGYPAIDVLTLDQLQLPPSVRPAQVRLYRYRVPTGTGATDPNIGGIPACARQGATPRTVGPVLWQLLILGEDYYVDPSGLWIALVQKADQRADYLAVSYITEDGTTVGTFPEQPRPDAGTTCATVDALQLIAEPLVGPEQPSFRHEMRQFYRIAGQDLDLSSLGVTIALNRSEKPQGDFATYLQALRLAIPTDPNVVDRDNRVFPRARDPGADQVIAERYLVFPHAQPFADGTRLTEAERNDSLYRTPLFLLFQQGPPAKFLTRLRYNSTGAGDRTTLNLNALQIREGSEQLYLGNRQLERGADYTISYTTGTVTFLNPDALFPPGGATITARFEERGLFAIAPTTILGSTLRYDLGQRGALNFVGIYQREASAFTRPPLGFEASANLIGGATAELKFRPNAITRFVDGLVSRPSGVESRFDVNAEFAFTKPDANQTGQAYLEEFEGESGAAIPLRETVWNYGSVPQATDGAEDVVGGTFERDDAVQVSWQNLVPAGNGGVAEFRPQDIDPNIATAGRTLTPETVLFFTFHADTAGGVVQRNRSSRWSQPERPGRPRWRSLNVPLSAVGTDFTRNEFIEFWVYQLGDRSADAAGLRLLLDLGSVDEDALAVAPESLLVAGTDSLFTGRQYVGEGRLDTERRPNGIFNAAVDDIGILGDRPTLATADGATLDRFELCQLTLGTSVPVFPWGDLSSRCSAGNGSLDTEDLDGDNALNARGGNDNVFRYVVDLQDGRYFVRDGVVDPATGAGWRLYRVPIRTPDATLGTPNLRLIQQLRMTLVAPDQGAADLVARFALARFRLVGSPWVRRADAPIAGLSGSTAEPTGEVLASIVSTLDSTDLGYVSPPGVRAALGRVDQAGQGTIGTQINERSLRLIARDLASGTRAEAYYRFPVGAQRFLGYRQLRLWMRGRPGTPGWETRELEGFVKVGSDDRNFYLYRTPLRSEGGEEAWLPEVVVDLETWRRLRAEVENRWLRGEPPSGADACGGDPAAYVACEGNYVVHLGSPGINPPNLAQVQEIAAGMLRVGPGTQDEAELWVDDIRLAEPINDLGVAWAIDARLSASDVADFSVFLSRQDGQFRQIGDQPSFRTTGGLSLGSTVRLDRFLPASLGLAFPVTVNYARNTVDPELLTGSDIPIAALQGFRRPVASTFGMTFSLRRASRGRDWATRILADPVSITGSFSDGRNVTELSSADAASFSLSLGYLLSLQRRGPSLGLGGLVKGLPRWLRESEFGKGLDGAGFSFNPSTVRFQSGLTRDQSDFLSYQVPIARDDDSLRIAVLGLNHVWRNSAGLVWQPLGMLTLGADLQSTRDLRRYSDSTELGRLATAERRAFLGLDVGVERDRTLTTSILVSPRVASWIRPRFATTSSFVLARTLNSRRVVREEGDTAGAFFLPQTLNNLRTREIGASVDYARGLRQLFGDSGAVGWLTRRFRPVDVSLRRQRSSTYDLAAFDPGLGFMLATGGLENFLRQEGNDAIGAAETQVSTASTGLEFPFGVTAQLTYSETNTDRYQRLAGELGVTEIVSREWPAGSMRFTRSFRRGPLSVFAVGSGLRRRFSTTIQPGFSPGAGRAVTLSDSRTLTPDVQLTFRNGLTLLTNYTDLEQERQNNGNVTELDQADISTTLSWSIRLPRSVSAARRTVRTQLNALVTRSTQCLTRRGDDSCEPISDTRRREFRASFDTELVRNLTGSLQGGYTLNDLRHLNRRTSQIFFLVSMNLSLYAGDYR